MLGLSNGIRENVSGSFIFARKSCDIVYLESSQSTLESTCRRLERWRAAKRFLNISLADFFSLIQRKRSAHIPVAYS